MPANMHTQIKTPVNNRLHLVLVVVVVFYYSTRDLLTACGFSQGTLDTPILEHENHAKRLPAASR